MKDTMVSIRMPESLAKKLAIKAEQEHFLDLSEFVRSVVRREWQKNAKPDIASELKSLSKKVEEELKSISNERVQKEVTEELRKIQENLKRGAQ